MQQLILTSEEKNELEKRGFLVKKGRISKSILTMILVHLGYLFPFSFFFLCYLGIIGMLTLFSPLSGELHNIVSGIGVIILHYPILKSIYASMLHGNTYYSEKGVIDFGKQYKSIEEFENSSFYKLVQFIDGMSFLGYFFSIFAFIWIFIFGLFIVIVEEMNVLLYCLIPVGILSFYSIILPIVRFFFQSFHPLYAFGNLGEKIQKLTPTIESKSKEIQENFQNDTNFRTLSEGFDSLSSTFFEIVRLVIKLEQVEKKANKGNLFDSEKYINSLRGDIVEPLKSLKSFLESQRQKLRESQEELQRVQVRVGGNTELTSESELSSKRGESLMVELDENIGKLEEMISKMS